MDYTGSALSWNGQAPDPDKSSRLLIRDFPHRAIAIVSQSHALIFRHSSGGGGGGGGNTGSYGSYGGYSGSNGGTGDGSSVYGGVGGGGSNSNSGSSNNNNNNSSSSSSSSSSKCMVEFSPVTKGMLSDYRPLTPRPIYGTLGLITVNQDVFLSVITQALRVATLRPGETVEMIQQVQFFCLNTNEYDDVLSFVADPLDPDSDAASVYSQGLSRRDVPIEHPCQELTKLLGNRSFYYSTDFDLTNRLQERSADASAFDIDHFDESFLWNSFMIQPLVQFRTRLRPHERAALDASRILTSAVRGFCQTVTIPQAVAPLRTSRSGMPSYLTVISRLSCRRAGTRFNARGIDDDGNVANFVETETIYWSPSGVVFSYVQVRGSVPVFWEQSPGLIPGHQKIIVTRSAAGAQPAFDRHFDDLATAYGAVHVINLLSEAKPGEAELSQCYRYGLAHTPLSRGGDKDEAGAMDHALIRATEYDFHAETRGPTGYEAAQEIRRYIEHSADGFAYYLAMEAEDAPRGRRGGGGGGGGGGDSVVSRSRASSSASRSPSTAHRRFVVVLQQEGVFRTNCLDCLDRTNLIQTIISQMAVEAFLRQRQEYAGTDFWLRHSNLWADNGDALSKIYAGTGALKSSFTRHGKMSLAGAIADARKSATRLYINNFADKGRQNTIDMLLGRLYGQTPVVLFDPISDFVMAELNKRAATFSSTEAIRIWVGTFNLNGRLDGLSEDLSPWLFAQGAAAADELPEIVAIGFQEIVELSPQQIMNSDPTRKQQWEAVVKGTLDRGAEAVGGEPYILLRSGQLVGAALCIFVRASSLGRIKNVEGSVKKTGMSGMAGNKGAVAIRLDYAGTSLCFVTAHLAAGFANYEERNRDYLTIHHGLRFQRNRGIDDHDAVLWFGDFNYRIGLGRERALERVRAHDLATLYENDQLNLQMVAGLAFPYYAEARITFPPTYKFDVGRDSYDSSEKQRIPAWTDRILRKGAPLRQMAYGSAPLRFSDHRPVYAHFACSVSIVDEAARDRIASELYARRKADVCDATANTIIEDTDDEDLLGYDAIEPGLPAASSDRQKWWLDNGRMAQAAVQPTMAAAAAAAAASANKATHTTTILNPMRPSNPFTPTDEPDWVAVPRAESRLSSFSSLSTSPYEHISHPTVPSSSANSHVGGGGGMVAVATRKAGGGQPMTPSLSSQRLRSEDAQHATSASMPMPIPPPPPPRRHTSAHGDAVPTARVPSTVSAMTRALDELRTASSASPASSAGGSLHGPPLPSRQTAASLSSRPVSVASSASGASAGVATKGKPAPPVAKKPAHLAAPASQPPMQPARRRTDLGLGSAATAVSSPTPPKLPARAPTMTVQGGGRGPVNGRATTAAGGRINLMDDADTTAPNDLARWQPLQPS